MFIAMDIFLQSLDTKAYVIIPTNIYDFVKKLQNNIIKLSFTENNFYISQKECIYNLYHVVEQCDINVEKNIFRNAIISNHDIVGIFIDKRDRLHVVRKYNDSLIVDALY